MACPSDAPLGRAIARLRPKLGPVSLTSTKLVSTQLLVTSVHGYQITAPGSSTSPGKAEGPCPSPSSELILRTIINPLDTINSSVSARVAGGSDVTSAGSVTDGMMGHKSREVGGGRVGLVWGWLFGRLECVPGRVGSRQSHRGAFCPMAPSRSTIRVMAPTLWVVRY